LICHLVRPKIVDRSRLLRYNKPYTGSIIDLADKAIVYVADAMDWRVEFDGSLERKEIPEIPVDAIREAVINAFAHRIIESEQSVDISVYKSFVEIYSPGKFPDGVTPEEFITTIRKPIRRNPLITRTLYYSKDMESFATGLKRIHEACSTAGVKVKFYGDAYGFTVRFYRHCGEEWTGVNHHQDHHQGGNSGGNKCVDWADRKERIIALIREKPAISTNDMAHTMNLTKRQIERALDAHKEEGRIRREGSAHGGRWKIN